MSRPSLAELPKELVGGLPPPTQKKLASCQTEGVTQEAQDGNTPVVASGGSRQVTSAMLRGALRRVLTTTAHEQRQGGKR